MRPSKRKPAALLGACVLGYALLISSAGYAEGEGTGRVLGVITADLPAGRPVRVGLATRRSALGRGVVAYETVVPGPGPFMLQGVAPGTYFVGAMIDLDADGRWNREHDVYGVGDDPVEVQADADTEGVVLDTFFNAAPRGPMVPEIRLRLVQQATFLYQAAVAYGTAGVKEPWQRRRAVTLQHRLRNILHWANDPGTETQHAFLVNELTAAAQALQELTNGDDPLRQERGPVRRAVHSAQFNAPWPYALYIPPTYDPGRTWPLFLVLHGAGGNADDMLRVACGAGHWAQRVLPGRDPFPPFPDREAFVLAAYGLTTGNPFDGFARNVHEVMASLDAVQADYAIDPHRTYVVGLSMGGGGAWRLGLTHPDRFAALGAISGVLPLPLEQAGDAPQLPALAVHGAQDQVIPLERVREWVAARTARGGRVELRVLSDRDHYLEHFGWDDYFAELERLGATRQGSARRPAGGPGTSGTAR